jgi:hypothetical protein
MFGIGSDNGRERVGPAAERLAAASRAPTSGTVASATIDPPTMRDIEFERFWTRQAAEAVKAEADELIRFAESRAGIRPVEDLAGRDFTRELLEELADARNYCVWRAQQELSKSEPEGAVTAEVGRTLEATVLAFAAAWRLREKERGA